jgi:hypothetical protein
VNIKIRRLHRAVGGLSTLTPFCHPAIFAGLRLNRKKRRHVLEIDLFLHPVEESKPLRQLPQTGAIRQFMA